MNSTPFSPFRLLAILLLAAFVSGCAVAPPAPLTPEGTKVEVNPQLIQQLRTAAINTEKQASGAKEVSEVLLAVTLEATLANFDYLQPIKSKPASRVDAKVEKVDMPLIGLTFTVPMSVRYSIRSPQDTMLFDKVIESNGVATAGDSILGAKRANMALQRAVQNNVDLFLKELATFKAPAR